MISILDERLGALLLITLFFTGVASASHYYDEGIDADAGFEIPQYETQEEILTQLVAPFLLIALVFQLGLERAMMFTLAEDDKLRHPYQKKGEKKRIKRQSMMLSLVITGMLVPTQFFQLVNDAVAIVFGGIIYLGLAVGGLLAAYLLLKSFSTTAGATGD